MKLSLVHSAFCIITPAAVTYIFNKKRKCCKHRCPDSVYFNTILLITYLSAIETLICPREMSLIGSSSFDFAQNTIHYFQNTILNSLWHCSRQMQQNLVSVHGAIKVTISPVHFPNENL